MPGSRTHDNALPIEEERRVYFEGIRLFNAGDFFEAHDACEEIWSRVQDRRRERFYRAIIRGAVTLELLRRGRAVGVRQVYVDCQETFAGLPEVFMGLDIPAYLAALRRAIEPTLADMHATSVAIEPGRLFQIRLAYDPFEASRNGEGLAQA